MKKKYPVFRSTLLLALFISLMACVTATTNDVNKDTDTKDLKDFKSISFNISGDLYLTQGNEFSVKIEAKPSDLEEIITYVEDNTLTIKTKNGWENLNDVKVYITMPVIEGVALAGSGNIYAKEKITSNEIDLSLAGSGNLNFENLIAEQTDASIAGSGNINLKGKTNQSFNVSIAGSGDINCQDLEAKDVNVSIAGSGSARVNAMDNLTTSIVGSGDVYYKGRPLINASSTGSGSTRPF